MLKNLHKTPWPWFGGKSDAAPHVWQALGDVHHYVEPFAGSLAVLLRRPHESNRAYYSETVNDIDGLLCNAWRAMQWSPELMAQAASWPVCEADLHARHLALLRWKEERQLEHLMADPMWHDPCMAGWWAWGQSCWIGQGWCANVGPWIVGEDGRIRKRTKEESAARVSRQLPHISNNGQGVAHAGAREPGVSRSRPHIGDDGQGTNRPQAREPGVWRQLPHLTGNGRGAAHAGAREPGVSRSRPHISNEGGGTNHPQTREPGVKRQIPHLVGNGQGANRPQAREPGVGEYHPMTMPELTRWFEFLSARLRHVRILNGDWKRSATNGALRTLPVRGKGKYCGVFLDPPYSQDVRDKGIYSHEMSSAAQVAEWAIENGTQPWLRIVYAGFDNEAHVSKFEQAGWRVVEWYRSGLMKGGMGNTGGSGKTQQKRERLWASPHCVGADADEQEGLW